MKSVAIEKNNSFFIDSSFVRRYSVANKNVKIPKTLSSGNLKTSLKRGILFWRKLYKKDVGGLSFIKKKRHISRGRVKDAKILFFLEAP